MSRSTSTTERSPSSDYEHLRRKRKERRGTVERATVRDAWIGEDEVVLRLGFEWTTETARLTYDLNDDRDVCQLEALAESQGFDFEQVGHLESTGLEVVYTGDRWVPTAHESYVEGRGSPVETFRTELRLLARELARSPAVLRGAVQRVRAMSLQQTIIAVVLFKKLVILTAVVIYLL
ncbi:hypothetical protein [Halomicrobium salinisoli]|uniref:hypothetical protein n=1 Tax=Halomicrobium salinisoli TaxID=2878391 RepID=UPI001CF03521|nr:hypothetical protein [Halomicrobium salinisoli]